MANEATELRESLGLSRILPKEVTVPLLNGEEVKVRPIKVRNIEGFIKASAPLYTAFMQARQVDRIDLPELLLNSVKDVIAFVAVGCDKPVEWVGDLETSDLSDLFFAVAEVNADFFTKRVLPGLLEKVSGVTGMLAPQAPQSPT